MQQERNLQTSFQNVSCDKCVPWVLLWYNTIRLHIYKFTFSLRHISDLQKLPGSLHVAYTHVNQMQEGKWWWDHVTTVWRGVHLVYIWWKNTYDGKRSIGIHYHIYGIKEKIKAVHIYLIFYTSTLKSSASSCLYIHLWRVGAMLYEPATRKYQECPEYNYTSSPEIQPHLCQQDQGMALAMRSDRAKRACISSAHN